MVRVLLCGDLRGRLRQLCEQVTKLHAKLKEDQRFEAVFCIGEFSSEGMELDVKPPIPVYFVDSGPGAGKFIEESPQGGELQPGVHFLGHYGVTRVAGLSVAFLSGRLSAGLFAAAAGDAAAAGGGAAASATAGTGEGQVSNPSWEDLKRAEKLAEVGRTQLFVDGCHYTPLTVERLREEIADSGGVDLLLTSEWPSGCFRGVPKEARQDLDKAAVQRCSSSAVAELAAAAEPKYHAVGLVGAFWRRPPWTHLLRGEVAPATGELRCGVCRMIALGAAEGLGTAVSSAPGAAKPPPQKWLHGLDLDPSAPPAACADATPSPWAARPEAAPGAGGAGTVAGDATGPLRPVFDSGDAEEQRRWRQRFGVLPEEMQSAADKVAKEMQPKEKKQKHQSIYYNQKGEKRFKAGKGSHEAFHQKERRAANGKSVASYF